MNKKLALTSVLILVYLLACWMVDLSSSKIVMDASGRSYIIDHGLLYDKYSFYRDGYDTYTELILKWDRIYLLCMSVVFLAMKIIKRFRSS
jgi:hypothetical protein